MKGYKRVDIGAYHDRGETILYIGSCRKDINEDTIIAIMPKLQTSDWVVRLGKEEIFNAWLIAKDLNALVPVPTIYWRVYAFFRTLKRSILKRKEG